MGPGGSGPIENNEEIVCDILTELISSLFKLYSRILESSEALRLKVEQEKKQYLSKENKLEAS